MEEKSLIAPDFSDAELSGFESFDGLMRAGDSQPSTSHAVHPADLDRVPSDLNNCRTRIDASVEEQRRYRQVIAGLSNTVSRYREKAADARFFGSSSGSCLHCSSLPATVPASSTVLHRIDPEGVSPHLATSDTFLSSLLKQENMDSTSAFILEQLREEQIRNDNLEDMNDMLRGQAEAAATANTCLRQDLARATQELKGLTVEHAFLHRQNQKKTQLLNAHNEQVRELWAACNDLRRQMKDFRTEIEKDLGRQKTEFTRCSNSMERAIHQIEIKRQAEPMKDSVQDEAFENLLKDYDKIAMQNMKLEHEQSERVRRLSQMESALKKANDERDALRDSLKKIHHMPELIEARGRRARSISPSGYHAPFDTIRLIRIALQNRDDEVRSMKRSCDDVTNQLGDLKRQLCKAEEARKETEHMAGDLRKELRSLKREKEEMERKHRRLCEKAERLDEEKMEANTTISQLRDEISSIHRSYQSSLDEMLQKQQEESDKRRKEYNESLEERDKENAARTAKLRNDIEHWREELEKAKEQLRNALADCSAERRRADEIERTLEDLRKLEKDRLVEIDELKRSVETHEFEVADLERQIDDFKTISKENETILSKLKTEKEALVVERSAMGEEISTLRSELSQRSNLMERFQSNEQESLRKIQALTIQIESYERSVVEAKNSVADLEAKLVTAHDKIAAMEAEREADKDELEKCRYDITMLHQEKTQLILHSDRLKDESIAARSSLNEMQKQITVLEKTVKTHTEQQANDLDTIEKLRSNERSLKNALDEVHRQLEQVNVSLQEKETAHKKDRENLENEVFLLEKRLQEDSKNMIDDLKAVSEKTRNEKIEVEKRLAKLQHELEERTKLYAALTNEYEDTKARLEQLKETSEKEIAQLKRELESSEQQHAADAAEWDRGKTKMRNEWDEAERKWKEEMKELEESHKESTMEKQTLKTTIDDLNRLCEGEKENVRILQMELYEREGMTKTQLENFDRERQQWSVKLRAAEAEGRKARADAEIAKAKCIRMENELVELQQRLSRKVENLNEVENELKEMEEKSKVRETAESTLKDRLAGVQREIEQLKTQRDHLRLVMEESTKEKTELRESFSVSKKELVIMRNRLAEQERERERRITELERVQTEKNEMMTQLTEKNDQLAALSDLVKQLEQAQKKAISDLEVERTKSAEADVDRTKMRAENERLSRDLAQTREILDKKAASSKIALNDIVENYRAAERARTEALREKETIAGELAALRDRLTMVDAKRVDAERRLADSEASRRQLQQQVTHFEASARRALSCARAETSMRSQQLANGAATTGTNMAAPTSFFVLRGSVSSQNIASPRKDQANEADSEQMDISTSVEITFRYLRDRIDQLEKDKMECSSSLARLRAELQRTTEQSREAAQTVDNLRRQITKIEEEKRGVESRLASSRQLLLSQEEVMRSRDREVKSLKSRLMSADLHSREKEAKIATLSEHIASLKTELSTMEEERRSWKESEALWEEEHARLEILQKRTDDELQRCHAELSSLSSVKENLAIRLSESERISAVAERRCGELEMAVNEYRSALARLQMPSKSVVSTRSSSVSTYRRTEIVTFNRRRREISESASIKLYKEC
uniref:Major antigen n=1 Tax=Ascaris suum TaxID=6253 RepID=F1KR11_ASCSU